MTTKDDVLDDRADFEAFAAEFARTLVPGDVVALRGGLGSGKTTFVRAVVRALHGSDDAVSSPTFVFRQRYDGTPPVEHIDLYRLEDPVAEWPELALDDAFDGAAVALVEWAERAAGRLPPGRIEVAIEGVGEAPRRVRITRPPAAPPAR